MSTLNVASKKLDDVVEAVKMRITSGALDEVSGPGLSLAQKLDARRGQTFTSLDLVSHSSGSECLLLLGDGVPEQPQFLIEDKTGNPWMGILLNPAVKQLIGARGITTLRLLGCLTAHRPGGREAMLHLKAELGDNFEVFGTSHFLTVDDFDAQGFRETSQHKLVSSAQITSGAFQAPAVPPPVGPNAQPTLGFDILKVPALSDSDLLKLRLSPHFVPRSRLSRFDDRATQELHLSLGKKALESGVWMSGLLAAPIREYWIEVDGSQPRRSRLVQILFDWHMVRVFSPSLMTTHTRSSDPADLSTNAAVYFVEDPARLKDFMSNHPQEPLPSSLPRAK